MAVPSSVYILCSTIRKLTLAFKYIYAILNFICVFAYIYCVYLSLYAIKNLLDKRVDIIYMKKIENFL